MELTELKIHVFLLRKILQDTNNQPIKPIEPVEPMGPVVAVGVTPPVMLTTSETLLQRVLLDLLKPTLPVRQMSGYMPVLIEFVS